MINLHTVYKPEWARWIAQDSSGAWWGYQVEPLQNHIGWYENEVGNIIKLSDDEPNPEWVDSLIKVADMTA